MARLLSLAFLSHAIAVLAHPPSIKWVDCHTQVPLAFTAAFPDYNLTVLTPTLHCGRIVVPMDYDRPIGPHNNITLGLAMYRPKHPKGVLFYNPGGTDPANVVAWQAALGLNSDFTPDFSGLLHYDLMMMDVRGTWSSNAINVSVSTFYPLIGPYPTTQLEFDAYEAASRVMFQSWIDSSSPLGIIQFVNTKQVTLDYDTIRAALGYEKINFLGCSYGTFRAAAYAAEFPQRVGRFVMDSVVQHGLGFPEQIKDDIIAANRALDRADAFCVNNASCPLHAGGKGSVQKAWLEVLAAAENGTLFACPTAAPCNTTLGPVDVQSAILGALSDQPDFPLIIEALAAAAAGDGSVLVSSGALVVEAVQAVPLSCGDNKVEDKTFAGFQAAQAYGEKYDKYHLERVQTTTLQLICSAWPFPVEPIAPLVLNQKMLLVTADFDPLAATERTTFEWTTQARNSTLLVRHGDDHVSFNLPKQASTHLTKQFLRTWKLPTAADDGESVTVFVPGTTRGPVADPYCVRTGFVAGDVDSA